MRKYTVLLCLSVLLSAGRSISAQPTPYAVKPLDVAQGLSNNYVLSITQDNEGFLWFATDEGLNKFDGTRFINYYKNDPNRTSSLSGNELNAVYADPHRPIVWIATQRDGLNAYNYRTQTFTAYRHDPQEVGSLITDDVTSIAPVAGDPDKLWLSTYYRGIECLDINTGRFTHYNKGNVPELVSDQVWKVLDGGDGNLYIAHVRDGLSILSLADKRVVNFRNHPGQPGSLPGDAVNCLLKDGDGNLWVGTSLGLALYNASTQSFVTFGQNASDSRGVLRSCILDIKLLAGNRLWIATELKGIAILDLTQSRFQLPEQYTFRFIREGSGRQNLTNASPSCIFQDAAANIWIGTLGGGINFIGNKPPLFSTINYTHTPDDDSSISGKAATCVCTDSRGRLWVGTEGDGINVFDRDRRVAIYRKETGELRSNVILSAFRDRKENLWFGTLHGGICCYEAATGRFHDIYLINREEDLDVRTFAEDTDGRIWMGCSWGIFVYDPDKRETVAHYHTGNSPLHGNLVRSIAHDAEGRIWVGTFGDGLGIYTPDMQLIKKHVKRVGFCSNTVNHIYRDTHRRLWVATGEGLVCFPSAADPDHYQTFGRKEGIVNSHIRAVTEDEEGNIWFSSNNGIGCQVASQNRFYNYGHADGVPIGNFRSGSVTRYGDDHTLCFGSINGVCSFRPRHTLAHVETPPVAITEMELLEQMDSPDKENTFVALGAGSRVRLAHHQNTFSLSFGVQDYALARRTAYTYMLKGFDDSWYTVDEGNKVTFRNIPPGRYTFLVRARVHNQDWSREATALDIHIAPPFWLTWWAQLAYALTVAAALFFALRAYKNRLALRNLYTLEKKTREQELELNQERLRFYTNIAHELRTPLTLIIGPLEDMQKDPTLSAKQSGKLSVIHQSALRLLGLINQLLEFRKTETQNRKLCVGRGNLVPLVQEIGLKYRELNRNTHIDLRIEVEQKEMPLFYDREMVTIMLDNLLSNAFKYTTQGEVVLRLGRTVRNGVDYTEISVSDTGDGIAAEALPHIFDRYYRENGAHQASGTGIGLALVKSLVELHEGEIRVESTPQQGSSFCISLLTDNTYPNALHADTADDATAGEAVNEAADREEETTGDGNRPILLVVEDNADIQQYITESLSDAFEIVTANNGEEGLKLAVDRIPDMVVSDVMMPVMDGITLCRHLKKDVRTSHIPVILLTAKDTLRDKEEGYEVGADSYLTKPFSASLLRSRIGNLIELRRKLASRFGQKATPDAAPADLKQKQEAFNKALGKLDQEFIERVTQLVGEHLSQEKVDITYLSDKLHMSSSTLYRKIKALTGLSTNEFVRKIKMQHAERLLLEGKYQISEIAFKVGMNSPGYFRQCFKDEYGVGPSEYLKQMKGRG